MQFADDGVSMHENLSQMLPSLIYYMTMMSTYVHAGIYTKVLVQTNGNIGCSIVIIVLTVILKSICSGCSKNHLGEAILPSIHNKYVLIKRDVSI